MRRAPTSVALAATGLLTVAGTVGAVALPELPGLAHRLVDVASAQPSGSAAAGADGRAATAPATSRPLPDVHRVAALGDSVPEGSACDCAAYPELVAQSLQTRLGHPVSVDNLGEAGSTSTDLAESLRSDPTTRTAVSGADLVVVTTGANDLADLEDGITGASSATWAPRVATATASVAADVALVHQLAPKARVLVTTYWNVFQDGDVVTDAATRRANDTLTTQFNAALVTSIGQSATVVDLYEPFKGGGDLDPTPLLADDGDHPDAAGHRLIAAEILKALTNSSTATAAD